MKARSATARRSRGSPPDRISEDRHRRCEKSADWHWRFCCRGVAMRSTVLNVFTQIPSSGLGTDVATDRPARDAANGAAGCHRGLGSSHHPTAGHDGFRPDYIQPRLQRPRRGSLRARRSPGGVAWRAVGCVSGHGRHIVDRRGSRFGRSSGSRRRRSDYRRIGRAVSGARSS